MLSSFPTNGSKGKTHVGGRALYNERTHDLISRKR